jgi:integrase/recombinase XerC
MREIPLPPSLCEELLLYLHAVDSLKCADTTPDAPLLQTPRGGRLYPVYVDRAVKAALGPVEGISGRKSPHVLRHTLATELLDGGADLNSIKELLGHSSLAATQVYTHNSIERLQHVYESAHPRAKNDDNHGD